MSREVVWIGYTTRYRTGGALLQRAARTLAASVPDSFDVRCEPVHTKAAFVAALARVPAGKLRHLHFVGHSGMYGPMFGTTSLPEQFSPHEWRELELPFAPQGKASFHACRTARWFAPFFARTFGVECGGHHLYTTFSQRPDRYVPPTPWSDVYVIAQPGRTSHGVWGALGKRLGWLRPEPLKSFLPLGDASGVERTQSYDAVASRYDEAFDDIRVRGPEWRWIERRVPSSATVLDLGCGTGALLRALGPRLRRGVGVDASPGMLAQARRRGSASFLQVNGPRLPLPDASVDVVVSLLSWRYLDWDPVLGEVMRVLRPGGRLLVVDMVTKAAHPREVPQLLRHRLRAARGARAFPGFQRARDALVAEPGWQQMLRHNPIRAEHELRWFFESRFAGRRCELLDLGRLTRVLAFDSGPVGPGWVAPQSYP